jgi:hypothetical protein
MQAPPPQPDRRERANSGELLPRAPLSERAVIDRLHKLRVILPVMAQERAEARREAARLRSENAQLARRLAEIESHDRA